MGSAGDGQDIDGSCKNTICFLGSPFSVSLLLGQLYMEFQSSILDWASVEGLVNRVGLIS